MTAAAIEPPTGRQFVLERPGQRAVVTEVGATLRSWQVAGRELLDTFGVDSPGDMYRGKVLVPWPNRIRDARYVFGGVEHRLAATEPERVTALHGLVLWANWRPLRRGGDRVTLGHVLHPQPGYPFTLGVEVDYALEPSGLAATLRATNLGTGPAPFGAGFHPYLSAHVDETVLELPAASWIPVDERGLPCGPPAAVAGTDHDFREARRIGSLALDACFAGLARDGDGRARVRLAGERELTVWMDGGFGYLQAYTADTVPDRTRRRRGIALEPMTCAPDAFNTGEGLIVLAPGETFSARWGIDQ